MAPPKRKRKVIPEHRRLIGEVVRTQRKRNGFTQESLAERVQLNPKYLGEVERGEKIISIEALMRIAKVCRCRMGEFFKQL